MRAGSYRQSLLRNHAPGCTRSEIGEIHGTDESNQMVWADAHRLRDRGDDSDLGVGVRAVAARVRRATGAPACGAEECRRGRASTDSGADRARAHRGHRQAQIFGLRNARGLAAAAWWRILTAVELVEALHRPAIEHGPRRQS